MTITTTTPIVADFECESNSSILTCTSRWKLIKIFYKYSRWFCKLNLKLLAAVIGFLFMSYPGRTSSGNRGKYDKTLYDSDS